MNYYDGNTYSNNDFIGDRFGAVNNETGGVSGGNMPSGSGSGGNKKNKKNKENFGRKVARTLVLALLFGLVAGGTFQGINVVSDKLRSDSEQTVSEKQEDISETETGSEDKEEKKAKSDADKKDADEIAVQKISQSTAKVTLDYDVADIVSNTETSIVSITTSGTATYQYFFQTYETPTSGAGSGIIIGQNDDSLYIATNYHVIEGASEINVGFSDGEIVSAVIKGDDENADIAVVEVKLSDMKESTREAITVASVGDSSTIQVGEPAIAIGNALGYGQTVTVGYISALNRSISGSDGTFIQTDAAINPGNSGGALINSKGEVIGINSVKYVDSSVEGMGFSIPINKAMTIINDIISGKNGDGLELGIEGADISREYSQIYGFPMGVYIKDIKSGSNADNADLHSGDIIVEFNGEEVYTIDDLQKLVKKCNAGETVSIGLYRANSLGVYEKVDVEVCIN